MPCNGFSALHEVSFNLKNRKKTLLKWKPFKYMNNITKNTSLYGKHQSGKQQL